MTILKTLTNPSWNMKVTIMQADKCYIARTDAIFDPQLPPKDFYFRSRAEADNHAKIVLGLSDEEFASEVQK